MDPIERQLEQAAEEYSELSYPADLASVLDSLPEDSQVAFDSKQRDKSSRFVIIGLTLAALLLIGLTIAFSQLGGRTGKSNSIAALGPNVGSEAAATAPNSIKKKVVRSAFRLRSSQPNQVTLPRKRKPSGRVFYATKYYVKPSAPKSSRKPPLAPVEDSQISQTADGTARTPPTLKDFDNAIKRLHKLPRRNSRNALPEFDPLRKKIKRRT